MRCSPSRFRRSSSPSASASCSSQTPEGCFSRGSAMTERLLYVVDDDPVIRQVVSRTASTSGYKPRSFAEVPEFEAAFRAEAPELILLDIAIGDHDGLELLNRLARWGCRCPILMVSGFDERVIASTVRVGKSLGLTMLEPLHKPLSPADLRALLQSISRTALPIREDDLGRALTGLELV